MGFNKPNETLEVVDPRTPQEIFDEIYAKLEEMGILLQQLPENDAEKLGTSIKNSLLTCLNHVEIVKVTAEELLDEEGE